MNKNNSKVGIGFLLNWALGLLFILVGIDEILEEFLFAITCILIGIYLLPPITSKCASLIRMDLSGWRKWSIPLILFVFLSAVSGIFSETSPISHTVNEDRTDDVDEQIKKEDSNIDLAMQDKLKKELSDIESGVNFSQFYNNVIGLEMTVELFSAWAKVIDQGIKSEDLESQRLAQIMKEKVSGIQQEIFPQLRKAYAQLGETQMARHEVGMKVLGDKKDIIEFTSDIFIFDENKRLIKEIAQDTLIKLRFKQIRFKTQKGDQEYTYLDLKTIDDEVVVLME